MVGWVIIEINPCKTNDDYDVFLPQDDANLFNLDETKKFIDKTNPDILINAAAKVGGIVANNTNRTEFMLKHQNKY